jgi:hypothetical protein
MELLPTHHCFDDALEYLNQRVLAEPTLAHGRALELVHAIAIGDDGVHYAHAWCEEDGLCWDAALYQGDRVWYSVRRAEYYKALRVHTITRYTVRQACLENLQSGHYGPWKDVYRTACGTDQRHHTSIAADATGATVKTWSSDPE